MRKNVRKSVVVLLVGLMMAPVLTACSNNGDITTSEENGKQTETKKTQVDNLGQERKNSEQNNSFAYYSMPSVLRVASLANNKAFSGVSGIAVDPDTRAEYYFAIGGYGDNKQGIVTITPRKTSKGIVSYSGDLNNLKTFNIRED